MVAVKMAQDEYTAMENELLKDKNSLKSNFREQELAHQEVVRQLKMVIFLKKNFKKSLICVGFNHL